MQKLNHKPITPTEAIEKIYGRCRDDAYIGWGSRYPSKNDPKPKPHYSSIIPVLERSIYVPEHLSSEICTSYIAPNSFKESVILGKTPTEYIEAYLNWCNEKISTPLYYGAMNCNIYELTSIFIDLDVGREKSDYTADEAIREIKKMNANGEVSLPSMFAKSGRGVYAIYLLKEKRSGLAPLKEMAEEEWKDCGKELQRRFEHLKVDGNAGRLCNWFKAPGTVDTKTGNAVEYLTNGINGIDDMPVYTLESLAASLELEFPEQEMVSSEPYCIAVDLDTTPSDIPSMQRLEQTDDGPRKQPAAFAATLNEVIKADNSQIAHVGTNVFPKKIHAIRECLKKIPRGAGPDIQRGTEIEAINEYRGGMKKDSCRYLTCFYYYRHAYSVLYKQGMLIKEADRLARQWTHELNNSFDPPLMPKEVNYAFRGGFPGLKNDYIASNLKVSEKEAELLGIKSIVPENIRTEREEELQRSKNQKKMIKEFINQDLHTGAKPADIIMSIEEHTGVTVSHQQINYWKTQLPDVVSCN